MIDKIEPVFRASLCDETVQQIIDLVSRDVLKAWERLPSECDLCKQFASAERRSGRSFDR